MDGASSQSERSGSDQKPKERCQTANLSIDFLQPVDLGRLLPMVIGSPAVTTQPSDEDEHESTKSKRAELDEVTPHLMQSVSFATSATKALNVGRLRTVPWDSSSVTSGIWKQPVGGRVPVRGVNIEGDDQADRKAHGGPDQAVYAYASDDYRFWRAELGCDLAPGTFGENLTIDGLDVSGALIGERWQIGSATFEVSQPRIPCYKLGIRMNAPEFPRRFAAAERPGAYLRIVREGTLGVGDDVCVISRPQHGLTAALI